MPSGLTVNPRWDYLNGIPKNPRWAYAIETGQLPDARVQCRQALVEEAENPAEAEDPAIWYSGAGACTQDRVTTDSGFWCGPHVNWRAALYEGVLRWVGWSGPLEDDDYNIDIGRPDQALYEVCSPDHVEIEFDSEETVDNYDTIDWWRVLHHTVDGTLPATTYPGAAIDGKPGIVIGLVGLDFGGHCGSPELHPAFFFAVHYDDNPSHDHWAFFVRNWGDEGWCSDSDHHLETAGGEPLQEISVLFPRPNIVEGAAIQSLSQLVGDPPSGTVDQQTIAGKGVVLTFHLPTPDQHGWIAGDIGFNWVFSLTPASQPTELTAIQATPMSGKSTKSVSQRPGHKEKFHCTPEDSIGALVAQMSSTQRAAYLSEIKHCRRPPLPKRAYPLKLGPPSPTALKELPQALIKMPKVVSVHEWGEQNCKLRTLCQAWGGHVPGHASMCENSEDLTANPHRDDRQ
jgi:hypothetical protein